MWNIPTENQLSRIPKLYETAHIKTTEKIIYMHFFLGGSDWYMAEYSPEERIFFGFAILNDDFNMAEWNGIELRQYISDKFADCVIKGTMNRTRRIEYNNAVLVNNL